MGKSILTSSYNEIGVEFSRLFKEEHIDPEDIMSWSFQVMTDYLCDVDSMAKYEEIGIELLPNRPPSFVLPPNVFQLKDVYESLSSSASHVKFNMQGKKVILHKSFPNDIVYINYIGIRVDEDGYPLINDTHFQACLWFCIHNHFMADFISGKMDGQRWGWIVDKMSTIMQATQSSFRSWTTEDYFRMEVVFGNMLTKIGQFTISHKKFE